MAENSKSQKKDNLQAQYQHHRQYLWAYYSLIALGFWLMTGFQPMGYETRGMIISDIISGFVLVVAGFLSLNPLRVKAMWAAAFVGGWLAVAPLILHAQKAVEYTTDTLIGILILSFMLVIPNIPGIKLISREGANVPAGWSYNPSAWPERIPVVFLGWLGFFVARYLAGYQMDFSPDIWDPFFGDGTKQILNSKVSESFPVSDAGLGAFAYILDVITGLAGRTARWRTMPWIVLIFGFLVIPLGIVSITLVILQPLAVGAWCTACLLSALITVGMIPFTFDEVLASLQFMAKKKKKGENLWKIFWFGGDVDDGTIKEYTKPGNVQLKDVMVSMWQDLKIKPWNLFLSILLGLWFMFSPTIFGYQGTLADSNHLVGAIVVAQSIIVMSEVVRTGRYLNMLAGVWLLISVWIFGDADTWTIVTQIAASLLLMIFSIRKGIINDQHGGFNKYII